MIKDIKVTIIKKIVEYRTHNDRYYIVKTSNGRYAGISDNYITNGVLNQQINGFQMFLSDTPDEVIERIENHYKIIEWEKEGKTDFEIMKLLYELITNK